jgi:hypothetical protein
LEQRQILQQKQNGAVLKMDQTAKQMVPFFCTRRTTGKPEIGRYLFCGWGIQATAIPLRRIDGILADPWHG